MSEYIVEYVHEVEITYRVRVKANSEGEAIQKVEELHEDVDFNNEEEINFQGVCLNAKHVEKI